MSRSTCEKTLSPVYLQNQLTIARKEIQNLRQQIISLNHIHRKECDFIYKKLEEWQCLSCKNKQNDSQGTSESSTAEHTGDVLLNYVGTISTNFPEKKGIPRQPAICKDMIAKLTLNNSIFTNPTHALEGLQEFSHMWILFHFHRNGSTLVRAKVSPPRLNGVRTGVFATRSPHRPCPIGLSLVKIDRIMENTIYFSGVDMVDQTPVLDIKPYIPQYDNPGMSNIYYPEESVFHAVDGFAQSDQDRNNVPVMDRNEASTSSIIQVNESLENLDLRIMDGEENRRRDHVVGAVTTENDHSRPEETFYARSNSRIGEREAPDGEEEESPRTSQPPTTLPAANTPEGHIRVPAWIDQPSVARLTVLFKDRALAQLISLGSEGEEKKNIITNVLKEDPRSVYLRERWGSHCYVFRIAELYVSCKFNDNTQSVTVYQVFQNEAPPEGDE